MENVHRGSGKKKDNKTKSTKIPQNCYSFKKSLDNKFRINKLFHSYLMRKS